MTQCHFSLKSSHDPTDLTWPHSDVDYFTMIDTEINAIRGNAAWSGARWFGSLTRCCCADGIDICQCRHVRVDRALIHNGGDDALVIKSDYSTGMPRPSFDHVYSNSVIGSDGASALRFGSETVGEIYDFLWENITITRAAKAAIGLVSMDGAHIHDIVYRNITAVRSTPLASERPAHTCERMTAVKTILCADQHGHPALFLHWGAESTAAHA